MSEKEIRKIEQSEYLDDNAKDIYKRDREKYLKEKINENEKAIDNSLSNIDNSFIFAFN